MAGSAAPGVELLAPPLGELELLLLEELGLLGLLAPPEADPDFGVSLEADPLMPPEDELDEDGLEGLDVAPLPPGALLLESEPSLEGKLLVWDAPPRALALTPHLDLGVVPSDSPG